MATFTHESKLIPSKWQMEGGRRPEVLSSFQLVGLRRRELRSVPSAPRCDSIPKLEQFLPLPCCPDTLKVYETCSNLNFSYFQRIDVNLNKALSKRKTSTLRLLEKLGEGLHATVFRGILLLPEPWTTSEDCNAVKIAVKFAGQHPKDKEHLANEAKADAHLSGKLNFLQQHWNGNMKRDYGVGGKKQRPIKLL